MILRKDIIILFKMLKKQIVVGLVAVVACSVALPSPARKKVVRKTPSVAGLGKLSPNDQKRYDYFFLGAIRQQVAGHYDAAFDLLEHARRINPDAAETYYFQALYYSQLQNDSLSLAYLQKAAELNPENDTYLESIATYYISKQQYGKAVEAFESLYAHNHDDVETLRILMQLYQQQRQYDKMLSTISRIELVEGESEQITLTKMQVYEMMDDKESAYRELKSLSVKHPFDASYKVMLANWLIQNKREKEAYKELADVLRDEPDNAYAQSSLYDYYQATGQEGLAHEQLDKILMGKKTDTDTKVTMIRQFIQQNEMQGADSTEVLALLDRVLALPQTTSEVAELRAAYMSLKKMPVDSINAAFQKVLDIAPDNAGARVQLVQNLWNAKRYDDVISMTTLAEAYNPDEMIFYYFGGMAYYQKDDEDATLATFRKAVAQVNDESSPELVSDLYMIMGDILHKKGERQEAFAAYDSCLQWKADNYAGLNNYAYYLSLQGMDLHKAEQMGYKAIKAEPNNATYLDTYAWILFMEERYAEAKNYIDQTLVHMDSTDTSATIYEHAGDIYSMNGLTEEALGYWEKALSLDAQSEIIKWKIDNKQYITEEKFKRNRKKWGKKSK